MIWSAECLVIALKEHSSLYLSTKTRIGCLNSESGHSCSSSEQQTPPCRQPAGCACAQLRRRRAILTSLKPCDTTDEQLWAARGVAAPKLLPPLLAGDIYGDLPVVSNFSLSDTHHYRWVPMMHSQAALPAPPS